MVCWNRIHAVHCAHNALSTGNGLTQWIAAEPKQKNWPSTQEGQ